eukprot:3719365-Pleurochrysis_carterae.AAC.1
MCVSELHARTCADCAVCVDRKRQHARTYTRVHCSRDHLQTATLESLCIKPAACAQRPSHDSKSLNNARAPAAWQRRHMQH